MKRWIAVVSLAALAACGSGDGSSSGTVPVTSGATPTPTPSATATPMPTPTPTTTPTPTSTALTTFDQLPGVTTLQSANSGFLTNTSPPQEVGVNAFGTGVRYIYNPQTKAIAVDNGPNSPSFVASDIDGSAPAGTVRYVKASGEQLILTQPVAGGVGLRWTRFIENTGNAPPNTRTVAVTGVPTPSADIPASGTGSFSGTVVVGDAYVQNNGQTTAYSLAPSMLSANINYTTRRITFILAVAGSSAGGPTTPLVLITGTTDFDGKSPDVSYASDTPLQTTSFAIGAALFGAGAAEAGGVFVYRGVSADRRNIINLVGRFAGDLTPR